ncbi:MAG: insulinase family protein [Clostridia bacterium]|nr:insulinase family protein [Clostridia bacterium]
MVKKIVLKNGVRILHERLTQVRSCAIGIMVGSGSRHEPEELCGISHFIEHMLFKGTEKRTAAQIAEEFDAIGGQVNAFTSKENTCYYARTLDTHVCRAAELLCDMFFNSAFREKDVELERGVIFEEIGMAEDTPESLTYELLSGAVYAGSSLARPILGYKKTLEGIDSDTLRAYRARNYTPQNTLVAVCGSYTDADIKYITELFESMPAGTPPTLEAAEYAPAISRKKKLDIEQNHITVAFPGIALGSDEHYAVQVMNSAFGGNMSSRLFQKVREQSGLCYTIYSYSSMYIGTGLLGVYVALSPKTELQALELIREEALRMKQSGMDTGELARVKEQIKAGMLMGMEDTGSRRSWITRNELIYGREITVDEVIRKVDAVTQADILKAAARIFDMSKVSISVVGTPQTEADYLKIFRK